MLEIVFLSFCENEASYEDFRRQMPWLAMPFSREKAQKLMDGLNRSVNTGKGRVLIEGFPTCVPFNSACDLIDKDPAGTYGSNGFREAFVKW